MHEKGKLVFKVKHLPRRLSGCHFHHRCSWKEKTQKKEIEWDVKKTERQKKTAAVHIT
jgi:ABC-type dipeptide/oligopeptide/nickel transport system ATPase component